LVQREHETSSEITPSLRKSLQFFIKFLPLVTPREVKLRQPLRKPLLIYNDASASSHAIGIGFVVIDPEDASAPPRYAGAYPPTWIIRELNGIYAREGRFDPSADPEKSHYLICPLEMLACACVYLSCPDLKDREAVHFIDNTSAATCAVYGYSSRPAMALPTHMYQTILFRHRTRVWHEWVKSEANIADLPSRFWDKDLAPLRRLKAVEVPMQFPSLQQWKEFEI